MNVKKNIYVLLFIYSFLSVFANLNIYFENDIISYLEKNKENLTKKLEKEKYQNLEFTLSICEKLRQKILAILENGEKKIKEYIDKNTTKKELKNINKFLNDNISKVFNSVFFCTYYEKKSNNYFLYFNLAVDKEYSPLNKDLQNTTKFDINQEYFFNFRKLSIYELFKFKNTDNKYQYNSNDKTFKKEIESCLINNLTPDKLEERNSLNINLYEFICSFNLLFDNSPYFLKIPVNQTCLDKREITINFDNGNGNVNVEILYKLKKNISTYNNIEVVFDNKTLFISDHFIKFQEPHHDFSSKISKKINLNIDTKKTDIRYIKEMVKDYCQNNIDSFTFFSKYNILEIKKGKEYKIIGFKYINGNKDETLNIFKEFFEFICKTMKPENKLKQYDGDVYKMFNRLLELYYLMKDNYFDEKEINKCHYLLFEFDEKYNFRIKDSKYYKYFKEQLREDLNSYSKSEEFCKKYSKQIEEYINLDKKEKKNMLINKLKEDYYNKIINKYKFNKFFKNFYNGITIETIDFSKKKIKIKIFRPPFNFQKDKLKYYEEAIKNINDINVCFFNLDNIKKSIEKEFTNKGIKINGKEIKDILIKKDDLKFYKISTEKNTKDIKKYYLLFSDEFYDNINVLEYYNKLIDEKLLSDYENNNSVNKNITEKNTIDIIIRKVKIYKDIIQIKSGYLLNIKKNKIFDLLYYNSNDNNLKKNIDEFIDDIFKIYSATENFSSIKNVDYDKYYEEKKFSYKDYRDEFKKYFLIKFRDSFSNFKKKVDNIKNEKIKKYLKLEKDNKFYNLVDKDIIKYIEDLIVKINFTKFKNLVKLKYFDLFMQILGYMKYFNDFYEANKPILTELENTYNTRFLDEWSKCNLFLNICCKYQGIKTFNDFQVSHFNFENIDSKVKIPYDYMIGDIIGNEYIYIYLYNLFSYDQLKKLIETSEYLKIYISDKNEIECYIKEYNDTIEYNEKCSIIDKIKLKINVYNKNLNFYKNNGIKNAMKQKIKILEDIIKKHKRIKDNIVLQNKEILKNLKEKIILNNSLDEKFKVKIDKEIKDLLSKIGITDITKIDINEISNDKLKNLTNVGVLVNFFKSVNENKKKYDENKKKYDENKKLYDENKKKCDGKKKLYDENNKSDEKNEKGKSKYFDTNIMDFEKNKTSTNNTENSILKKIRPSKKSKNIKEIKSDKEYSTNPIKGGCCKGCCKCRCCKPKT